MRVGTANSAVVRVGTAGISPVPSTRGALVIGVAVTGRPADTGARDAIESSSARAWADATGAAAKPQPLYRARASSTGRPTHRA